MAEQEGTEVREDVVASDVWAGFPDGLLFVDHDQIVRFINHQTTVIIGRSREELLGHNVREVLPFMLEDGSDWWQVSNPWQGLRIRTGHRERLLHLPDGRQVLATARYLRPGRNEPTAAVVMSLRDAELRRRAELANATLITTISHELRSPLAGIKGFSATLLRQWDRFPDEHKRELIEAIEADADRVSRLITDLLDVSRLDAGRLVIRPQLVEIGALLDRHAQQAQEAVGPDRDVRCTHDPAVTTLFADPDRLNQILGNLVENAVRHGRGTITLAAAPAVAEDLPAVDFTIADEGDGIDEQHRAVAFTRFWHRGHHHGSSGLGLYLVQGLAQAHRGSAGIETAPGGGALVRVRIPVQPVD